MGRDVTGLRVSSVKAKPNGVPHEAVREIYSRTSRESSEAKGTSVKEGSIEVAADENSNAIHEVLGVKSPNLEEVKNDSKAPKVEETKPTSPEKSGLEMTSVEDVKSDLKSSKVEETKSTSPEKSGLEMTSVENVEIKHAVQKPLDSTEDQLACTTPVAAKTPALHGGASPSANILQSPSSSKKSQPKTPFASRKLLEDEDNWSMASTTASIRRTRSRTTVPVAPKFSVTGRLDKRKEFYEKLEEKHKALEEEKREYEERNKEEEQAAIKQLRKTMVYKANPVPNFYYEGPPPKKELKKLPTTRAVSPKLSRRKSSGDAVRSPAVEKEASARPVRHSLGSQNPNLKQGYLTPTSISKTKGLVREQSGGKASSGKPSSGKASLKKEHPKQQTKDASPAPASAPGKEPVSESPAQAVDPTQLPVSVPSPAVPQNITEQANTNISVHS